MQNFPMISLLLIGLLTFASCGKMWGHTDLGDDFSLSEGDKEEDRVIMLCNRAGCNGGEYVIPTYEMHYDTQGNYAEYVKEATSDSRWIVAKTFQIVDKKEKYYILDKVGYKKSTNPKTYVMGPYDRFTFSNETKALNIKLDFKTSD